MRGLLPEPPLGVITMRRLLLSTALVALVTLAGCKKADESTDRREPAASMAESAAGGGAPDISLSAAPGVAFTYRYSFVLPDKGIAAVQETHAAACEKLGPSQCRITGMRYSLLDDDRTSAELDFKLAPELARAFGKQGIAAVEKAAGKLVDAEINGDDVSTTIDGAKRTGADAAKRLTEIEGKLKAGGLGDEARSELEAQAAALRDQLASAKDSKAGAEAQLASTPMTFNYTGDIGFSLGGNPVGEAVRSAWSSFSTMIWFMLMGIGVVLPWALLGALLIALWRSRPGLALRRFLRGELKPATAESD